MALRFSSRQWAAFTVSVVVTGIVVVACGTDRPDGAVASTDPPTGACATPNDGCPCGPSGTVVPCGKVSHKDPSGYVVCMTGNRTCLAGRWGTCETTGDTKTATYTVGSGVGIEPAGGVKTMALGVPADCTGATGLGVNLCVGGTQDGKKCSKKPPNCPGGTCSPGHCHGGPNDRGACTTIADCPGGTQCHLGDGVCVGGAKNGDGCKLICPGGTCNQYAGICDKGTNDDKGCNVAGDCPGGTCDISEKGLCVGGLKDSKHCKDKCGTGSQCSPGKCQGGPNDKNACFTDLECIGGTCKYGNGKCVGGANNGIDCDTDCPLGLCSAGKCNGGVNNNNACYTDTECPGGTCKIGDGKCIGGTNAGGSCKSECPGGSCFMPGSTSFSNPCDPYCTQYVDTPIGEVFDGGVVTPGGGLTIPPPDAGPDGGGGGGFVGVPGGIVTCGGATNLVVAGSCSAAPGGLQNCQQDFRCDAATDRCVWNGATAYFNPAAGGVDLTVGAPCGPSGSGSALAPVCNRGSATLPAASIITFHVTAGVPPPCTNPGAPTFTFATTAPLAPGQCVAFNLGNSLGNKMITVNAGNPGPVVEGPGLCANNSAAYKDDGAPGCAACGPCNTTITGKVYDPSGAPPTAGANNMPLAGIAVFEPSGPLTPLTDGKTCDSCASLDSPAVARASTDATGSFTLSGVTPSTATRLVVQSGRWRREITVPVTACVANAQTAGTVRMPQSMTDFPPGGSANLPKIAVVTGSQESYLCMLRKMGVAQSEIGPADGSARRVHAYRLNGMNTSPAAPASTTLYNAATLDLYTAIVSDCPGQVQDKTAAQRTALLDYVNTGGRLFYDHFVGDYVLASAEWPVSSTWNPNRFSVAPSLPARGRVLTGTPAQQLLHDWLNNVAASTDYGTGWVRVDEARLSSTTPAAGTVEWMRGKANNNWGPGAPPGAPSVAGDYSLSFSFETPLGGPNCGIPGGTGRVLYNDMHVAPPRGTTGTFPGSCNLGLALAPEEKALEYQLFQLTACQVGGNPPPPPPPPPPALPSITIVRDYQGICGVGERPLWAPFYWEAVVPPGTSVQFSAGTAATQAGLPATETTPGVKVIGNANTTVLPPAWGCDGCPGAPVPVDTHLRNDPPPPNSVSQEWLRVFMKFNPIGSVAPTVLAWRQVYSCVPAE